MAGLLTALLKAEKDKAAADSFDAQDKSKKSFFFFQEKTELKRRGTTVGLAAAYPRRPASGRGTDRVLGPLTQGRRRSQGRE